MKQGLQLKFSQQLSITPQLQQAIRLLQLSTLELQQEIQLALENNPLLELDEDHEEIIVDEQSETKDELDTREALEQTSLPEELPLDIDWETLYTVRASSDSKSEYNAEALPLYQGETTQTLFDYLMWQASLTPFTDIDSAIATAIIDAIDESGYLTVPLDDILESLGNNELQLSDVDTVLKRLQCFDPIGIAARNLQECLRIQLAQYSHDTPYLSEANLIIEHHLDLVANRDFRTLIRITKLKEDVLKNAIKLIQSLNPRPGLSFQQNESDYVIPDVLVYKRQDQWRVELNQEETPRLKINQDYAALSHQQLRDSDSQFIRSNLQEARWLIKSLESRNETLMKVSRCIVEQQQAFFEKGVEYMRPMVLADIAQQVDMHESTISRVTTQKYLHCPSGIFELKYFFSSRINTQAGEDASSTAIRALVKKMITAENPAKPLSDSKLTALLAEQGFMVARRTVAKYRESLSIPPSHQRKKLV